jgi:hypothetical protein
MYTIAQGAKLRGAAASRTCLVVIGLGDEMKLGACAHVMESRYNVSRDFENLARRKAEHVTTVEQDLVGGQRNPPSWILGC